MDEGVHHLSVQQVYSLYCVHFSLCQILFLLLHSQIIQFDILCTPWTSTPIMNNWRHQCSWIRFWRGNYYFNLLSRRTGDGAAILILRRSSAVANEEQLEHSFQSQALTTQVSKSVSITKKSRESVLLNQPDKKPCSPGYESVDRMYQTALTNTHMCSSVH